ncbi:MAG: hypothetical protein Hyperionvirus20_18 [Hyperionvirus sp.]|uniref:Uncharacterized protein n=1 Tax=Hyperionvirus sp. TaxID=2487770 RepID=A0A3G5AAH6_9VIRU|nr:MAG: hypothetical protein Hyperionvirus20_18 [Hyperionvirus sp.]
MLTFCFLFNFLGGWGGISGGKVEFFLCECMGE